MIEIGLLSSESPRAALRVILTLTPKCSHPYDNDYHYYLQSLLFSLIREGGNPQLHEKAGYKFFCFSNIFPFGEFTAGVQKSLIVSSPDPEIVHSVERACLVRMKRGQELAMGKVSFVLTKVSRPFRLALPPRVSVRIETPIIVRIPESRFSDYGIEPKRDYKYVFWRDSVPLEAFIKQLLDNMEKKVHDFLAGENSPPPLRNTFLSNGTPSKEKTIPELAYFRFIRSVAKPITVKQKKQMIIGSIWDLGFTPANENEKVALEIALDSGLGERNSLGFGFVNPF